MTDTLWVLMGFFTLIILIWGLSVVKKDASIVDRFWGLLFVALSMGYYFAFAAQQWRSTLVLALVFTWGTRLALHIHIRNRGHGEDIRYRRMRDAHGASFWWYSFFSVFLLQGVLALLISAPLYTVFRFSGSGSLLWSDAVGIILWIIGFSFEAGGDWQLQKFKADPQNRGKILKTGFWALSRHPNYFGDACLWWGFYFFALSSVNGWVSFFGPVIMTFFLRYVSGVSLLEKDLKNAKPGYKEYMESTPAFIPRLWPRRKGL